MQRESDYSLLTGVDVGYPPMDQMVRRLHSPTIVRLWAIDQLTSLILRKVLLSMELVRHGL